MKKYPILWLKQKYGRQEDMWSYITKPRLGWGGAHGASLATSALVVVCSGAQVYVLMETLSIYFLFLHFSSSITPPLLFLAK